MIKLSGGGLARSVSYSQDNDFLIAGARRYDLNHGGFHDLTEGKFGSWEGHLRADPRSEFLLLACNSSCVWELTNWNSIFVVENYYQTDSNPFRDGKTQIDWSPSGNYFGFSEYKKREGGYFRYFKRNGDNVAVITTGKSRSFNCFAICPNDELLIALGTLDHGVYLWEGELGAKKKIHQIPRFGEFEPGFILRYANYRRFQSLAFSPKDSFLAMAVKNQILVRNYRRDLVRLETRNYQTKEKALQLKGHQRRIRRIAFNRTGDYLISVGDGAELCFWNWREERLVDRWELPTGSVYDLQISPNSYNLAVAAKNGVFLFDVPADVY